MAGRFYELDLSPEFMEDLKDSLADMVEPVEVDVFIGPGCETCEDTVRLMRAFGEAAPVVKGEKLLKLRILDKSRPEDRGEFSRQGIERIPSVTLIDGYIRYTGIPAGEEVRGLVETILRISEGDSGLEDETKKILANLKSRVYIEVVVTPSCPYCPYAVLLANMLAYEAWRSGRRAVIADTVEAYENPDIADKYNVMSVPAIALNGKLAFIGVPYEEDFINYIVAAAEGRLDELVLKEYEDATSL